MAGRALPPDLADSMLKTLWGERRRPLGGGSGAPTDASYVVMGANATLTNERVLTAGPNIAITDAGAGGNVTISGTAPTGSADAYTMKIRDISATALTTVCYVTSTGECYFGLGANTIVRWYNLRTHLTGTVAVTGASGYVLYCPSNDRIYVSCGDGAGFVRVVNPATRAVVATINMPISTPRGSCYDAVSGYIYVVNGNCISEINPATNTVLRTSAVVAAEGVPLVTNGKIYFHKTTGIGVMSRSAMTLTTTLGTVTGDISCGSCYDSVNDKVWIGTTGASLTVQVVNPQTDAITTTIATSSAVQGMVYDPTSLKVYGNGTTLVYVFSPTLYTIRQVATGNTGGTGMTIDGNLGCLVSCHGTSGLANLFTRSYE